MDFGLSEEQELLQATLRQFVARECSGPRLREHFESPEDRSGALWRGLAELGVAGLVVPEELGGAGLELLDLALVAEELGHGALPGPFLGHSLACLAISLAGSAEQRRRWLPRLAAGEALGSVALAEAEGGGWQPEDWTAKADATASGVKDWVPAAPEADLFVVGVAGGRLALVERGAKGVTLEPMAGADRTRRTGRAAFDGAPCELLPAGAEAAPRLRDAALVLLAADAFGGARRCLELSVEYAKTREQFGVPIGHFQALKHQLANMALEVEPSRALYWFAAHAFDRLPDQAERAAALAKAHLSEAYMQVARDAVEAHGGIGFTWECDLQIWFKRALFDRAFCGAPSLHRERAARLAGW
jgi:alkylation response protein AidB-like acyl-CoA dehydrogenase